MKRICCLFVAGWMWMIPVAHAALPDEIAIYTDDIAKPGETDVELHVNATPQGIKAPGYPGEVVAHHGLRATAELSYGLSDDWETGLYLPVARSAGGGWYAPGARAKLKWLPLKAANNDGGYFFGLNLEVSAISRRFEPQDGMELMVMGGVRRNGWLFALNPRLLWAMNQWRQAPGLSLNGKLEREVSEHWAFGAEYYSGLGTLQQQLPFNQQANTLYLVTDYSGKPFDFNFGIGRGLTNATDPWTVKAVVELPF